MIANITERPDGRYEIPCVSGFEGMTFDSRREAIGALARRANEILDQIDRDLERMTMLPPPPPNEERDTIPTGTAPPAAA